MVKKQKDDLARRRLSTRARPGRSRGALGLIAACMQLLEEALGMGHYGERRAAGCSPCRETPCASNLRLRYSVAAAAPRNYVASKNSPKNSPSFSRFRQPWPSRIVCSSPVRHTCHSQRFLLRSRLARWMGFVNLAPLSAFVPLSEETKFSCFVRAGFRWIM